MRRAIRRTVTALLALLLLFSAAAPRTAAAAGTITGVKFSGGIMSWNAYPGVTIYWVGVDGNSVPVTDGSNQIGINELIDQLVEEGTIENDGTLNITLEGYDENNADALASWSGTYSYTSSKTPPEPGEIQNVRFTGGKMTWDPYPGAVMYFLYVDDLYNEPEGTSFPIDEYLDQLIADGAMANKESYPIRLEARDDNAKKIGLWKGDYKHTYTPPGEPGKIQNVRFADGKMTWDAWPGTVQYWVDVDGFSVPTGTETSIGIDEFIDTLVAEGSIQDSGTHNITLEARGGGSVLLAKWSGQYSHTYAAVTLPKTSLKKVTGAKKAIKVQWKKQKKKVSGAHITGYEIQVATDKQFTENLKTVKVKGYKKTSATVKKLKGGKKYYVRVRVYMETGGIPAVSAWSKTKSVKTKKK